MLATPPLSPLPPSAGITLVGLGPGDPGQLTLRAWQVLSGAKEVYLRTRQHPMVAHLPAGLHLESFDALYDQAERFEDVYSAIVARILELGQQPEGVIYAVPGHPFIAESTGPEIARQARELGIPVRVVDGVSFLEAVFGALGVDPFPQVTLADAFELAARHHPALPPDQPALIGQLHSRAMASEVKLTLMAQYPDEHPVSLVHAAGTPQERVEHLPLYEIDRSEHTGLLTSLYLPPLGRYAAFESLQEIVAHLRAPEGCPWDREQTIKSLRPHLLEEAYEALAAMDSGEPAKMREEMGDLMLMITMIAQIASENGDFQMADVLQAVNTKLVRRHPHVFDGLALDGVEGVLKNWEKVKAEERKTSSEPKKGLLDGVPLALPALTQSKEIQERASRVGFDWDDIRGVYDKIMEEITEVKQAEGEDALTWEIGDLLFVLVRLASWLKVDAETALRESNLRFRRRFAHLETAARQAGRELTSYTLDEMNALWDAAKAQESSH